MARLARLLVVALIAVFAAWLVAQAAGATAMSLEMAAAASSDMMDMPGCDDCDSGGMADEGALQCHSICIAPVVADLAVSPEIGSAPAASHTPTPAYGLVGRTDPPDPYPPRVLLI